MLRALTSYSLRLITVLILIAHCSAILAADCFSTTPISPNQTINASLDGSECLVSDFTGDDDHTYYDLYYLTLMSPTTLTITMESQTFDTFLALLHEDFLSNPDPSTVIDYNDDMNSTTTNSEITVSLDSGHYIIMANSFWNYETGAYTLKTSAAIDPVPSKLKFMPWLPLLLE